MGKEGKGVGVLRRSMHLGRLWTIILQLSSSGAIRRVRPFLPSSSVQRGSSCFICALRPPPAAASLQRQLVSFFISGRRVDQSTLAYPSPSFSWLKAFPPSSVLQNWVMSRTAWQHSSSHSSPRHMQIPTPAAAVLSSRLSWDPPLGSTD